MQLMPATAAGLNVNPNDVQQNIQGGVQLLANLLSQYGGDVQTALWAYNAGPGNVANGVMPSETQAYIPAVLADMANYGGTVPSDLTSATEPTDLTDLSSLLSAGNDGTVSIFGYSIPSEYALAGGIILIGLVAYSLID